MERTRDPANDRPLPREEREYLPLAKAAEMLLDECRMVLPGIQALFGFQLVAVFSEGFGEKLTPLQQQLHGFAIGLVAVAVMLIMAPAAYHRLQGARHVTETFIYASTRLLLLSMLPLATAICLDLYLVLSIPFHGRAPVVVAALLFVAFMLLWFVFPRSGIYQAIFNTRRRKR